MEEMIPKEYFVTSGRAVSPVSKLNAFDLALRNAKIDQCNIVPVSSVLPPGCRETTIKEIPPGAITFAVMARMDGDPGERIGAGIGWGWAEKPDGLRYGFVAEAHGYKDFKSLEREIFESLKEMARIRGMKLINYDVKMESLSIPKDMYGCAVAALVFVPWGFEETLRKVPFQAGLPAELEETSEKSQKRKMGNRPV